jgi:hypothetical protein
MTKSIIVLLFVVLCLGTFPGVVEGAGSREPLQGDPILIPGVIQAEDFALTSKFQSLGFDGMDVLTTDGDSGGYHVSNLAKGEWLAYKVSIPEEGYYSIQTRVASAVNGGFSISLGDLRCAGTQAFIGHDQRWQTVTIHSAYLLEGTHELRFKAEKDGLNLDWLSISKAAQTPFGGTPANVPGMVQAENYDMGGQYVAYYDTTPGNVCYYKSYRFQDVDVENNPVNPSTINVGWIATNEWLEYTINVRDSDTYRIYVSAACPSGGKVKVAFDGSTYGMTKSMSATGGSNQSYLLYQVGQKYLTAGQHIMKVTMLKDLWNLNSIMLLPVFGPDSAEPANESVKIKSPSDQRLTIDE